MSNSDQYLMRTLLNVERLRLLRQLALLEDEQVKAYNQLTELATKITGAPISMVSMITAEYQFAKGYFGLEEPVPDTTRRVPLIYSFCRHVVASNQPLVAKDTREHDLVKDNPSIWEFNVLSYLGMPLTLSNGSSLGTFCVLDTQPHDWSDLEIAIMQELSEVLIIEFETRARVNLHRASLDTLTDVQDGITNLVTEVDPGQYPAQILEQIKALRVKHDLV